MSNPALCGYECERPILISHGVALRVMLPDRCSIVANERRCVNPPTFVISVMSEDGEYMVGVVCQLHRHKMSDTMASLQKRQIVPQGKIRFTTLKAVGTDCINASPDSLIQL